jgi:hypothetical protein
VRAIPAIAAARVGFHPLERGDAQVDATIVERPRAPLSYPSWIGVGIGALANREVAATFANVSGGGDALDVSWRWWAHRPRTSVAYSAPGPWGIWTLRAAQETQTFGRSAIEETRTTIGGEIGNWLTERLHLSAGLASERWNALGRTAAVSTRAQLWPVIDRVSLEGGVAGWRGSDARFAAADVRTRLRSRTTPTGTVFLGEAGFQIASAAAPASIWPGADTGHARDVLLRAHPLLDAGIIADGVFGRRLWFASAEAQHWLSPIAHHLLRLAPAVFVDTARASRGLAESNVRIQIDAGGGVRLALPGAGVLRIDVAHGLRDGRTALSVGWQR